MEGVRIEVLAVEDFTIQQLKLCLIDYEERGHDAIADGKHQDKQHKNGKKAAAAAKDPDTNAEPNAGDDS